LTLVTAKYRGHVHVVGVAVDWPSLDLHHSLPCLIGDVFELVHFAENFVVERVDVIEEHADRQ
jgi:hypothetical protein